MIFAARALALSRQPWFRECVMVGAESVGWVEAKRMDPVERAAFLIVRTELYKMPKG